MSSTEQEQIGTTCECPSRSRNPGIMSPLLVRARTAFAGREGALRAQVTRATRDPSRGLFYVIHVSCV